MGWCRWKLLFLWGLLFIFFEISLFEDCPPSMPASSPLRNAGFRWARSQCVVSIPGIQPSIWWKLLRAHFVFWGYHQEISRKFMHFSGIFVHIWSILGLPRIDQPLKKKKTKNRVDTTAVSKIPFLASQHKYRGPVGPVHGDVVILST